MEGFFKKEEIEEKQSACLKCGLYLNCITPKMKSTGKGKRKILIIAEAPGKKEDEKGIQLIGESGMMLRKYLSNYGIDLDRDCWKTNAVCCRPPKNRTPTKKEINSCNPRMMKTIKKRKPNLIILLGAVALDSFLLDKFSGSSGGINRWRGFVIPEQRHRAWVAPIYHPSFIIRSKGNETIHNLFSRDIKEALKYVDKEVPIEPEYKIRIVDGFHLSKDKEIKLLAFDYETTGLKPYREGHKIICSSYSVKENEAFVFKIDNRNMDTWRRVLRDKHIPKTAHNLKFEHQWSKHILKVVVNGWRWDSMIGAHIQDNRKYITGLKFQAYINFGQVDYSSHIEKYLKSDTATGFNKVEEAPIEELLKYCGTDSLLQFKLAKSQMEKLK